MTIELHEGRTTGEMRIVFSAAVPIMWSVFGLLYWYAESLDLPLLVVGFIYLLMGILGVMGLAFARGDYLDAKVTT